MLSSTYPKWKRSANINSKTAQHAIHNLEIFPFELEIFQMKVLR